MAQQSRISNILLTVWVEELMYLANMDQQTIATGMGLSKSYLAGACRGKRTISRKTERAAREFMIKTAHKIRRRPFLTPFTDEEKNLNRAIALYLEKLANESGIAGAYATLGTREPLEDDPW